jgi:alpha-L-fucosidase
MLSADDVGVSIDQVTIGNGDLGLPPDIWNLPPLQVTDGQYPQDWQGLGRIYSVPEWWRDAKFGAWAHWDPQSMPEQGDWYARGMYIQGSRQYKYHIEHFGHHSGYGYKDICYNWVIDRWNPDDLMKLYVEMGAKYFMAMGVHHDNLDCYNSKYQPWNSVNVGPKVDIVGMWEKIARKHEMYFGIGFHDTPARTWGQFMPVRYTSDKTGPMQGISYDVLQTVLDGKGKWWEGMDPADLYRPPHIMERNGPRRPGNDPLLSPFANQFMWRVDDAITKYHPDLLPYVDRSLVKSTEAFIEPEIMAYPFQTETTSGEWHYQQGQRYLDASTVIQLLMQNVSRNGSLLLNISMHGRGNLDPEAVQICKDVGAWLKVNGEAVYASRPFEVCEEDENVICYTRNKGNVYATLLDWNGGPITLKAMRADGATLGKVTKVEMLGSDIPLSFIQNDQGLTITPGEPVQPLQEIKDHSLASVCRVLRITHDKGWFNDDDPGATYPGWMRRSNLGTGDYNNDLTISDTPGDVWSCSFTGSSVTVIAPKEQGAGKIEVHILSVVFNFEFSFLPKSILQEWNNGE